MKRELFVLIPVGLALRLVQARVVHLAADYVHHH